MTVDKMALDNQVQSNLQYKGNNNISLIIIYPQLQFDFTVLLILIWLQSKAVIKYWLWSRQHTKICNPNDIYTNHNINTEQQSICCVKYYSGIFIH